MESLIFRFGLEIGTSLHQILVFLHLLQHFIHFARLFIHFLHQMFHSKTFSVLLDLLLDLEVLL